jgi:succinoglycan biosynthesis transport protein ExoP
VDLRRQITIIRRWLPLLVVSVLLAGAAAFVVSNQLPKTYEAKATLIVGQSLSAANPDYTQILVSQRLSTTYAAVATKRPILEAVISQLDLRVTSGDLAARVRADAPPDSTLLTVTAQDQDPDRAAAIANALADQLIAASPAIQGRQTDVQKSVDADLQATQDQIKATQAQVEALTALTSRTAGQDAQLQALEDRLITLRQTFATLLGYSSGDVSNLLSVIEPAIAPSAPSAPRPLLNAALAAVLGLLLAGAFIFAVEYLDDTIGDADGVLEAAGVGTLGAIGQIKVGRGQGQIYRLAALLYPRSAAAEAYRTIRTNIEFASVDAPTTTLLVTSAGPGEGKTVTAANLAVVFAQAGRRVLLVDADLRKPGVHTIFDLPNAHGLTTLLRGDDVSLDAVAHATEQANLQVLTAGPLPPDPAELLGSQRMREIVDRLKEQADLVIFDSSPVQAVADASVLSCFLGGTVLVVHAGHSRRGNVRKAREALATAGANVLGAVLNRIPGGEHSHYSQYYGGYGGDHGAATEGAGGKPPAADETAERRDR